MRRPPPLAERIQTRLPDTAICRSDERALSDRFEVSRTPAREAILQLAAAGLVRTTPRRGAVVTGISAEEAVNMMETLAALEAEAAMLAARRMPPSERDALEQGHTPTETAPPALARTPYPPLHPQSTQPK